VTKAAFVILADTGSMGGLGRVVNALEAAKEFVETPGDHVYIIFDGAGTKWVPELKDEAHDYHHLYAAVEEVVRVCDYCADVFDVEDAITEGQRVSSLAEYDGHPSIRSLVDDDFEIITY
jgi:hypothetical protein